MKATYATCQSDMAALEKIFQLLDVLPDLTDRPDATRLGRIGGELHFEEVSFAYRLHERRNSEKATPTGMARRGEQPLRMAPGRQRLPRAWTAGLSRAARSRAGPAGSS